MALTYKISESGLYKIVEIIDNSEIIGRRKFLAKEVTTVVDDSTVQLKDAFTGEVLFSGESANFVKNDGTTFGDNAADAAIAMNASLTKVEIAFEELSGIEVVSGGIDFTNYVTTSALDAYKVEAEAATDLKVSTAVAPVAANVSTLNTTVQTVETNLTSAQEVISTIPQVLAATGSFSYSFQLEQYTAKCKTSSAVTFTVPANGKIRYTTTNHRFDTYGLAQVKVWLSTVAPPTSNYSITVEPDATIDGVFYNFGIADWTQPNLEDNGAAVGLTGVDLISVQKVGESRSGRQTYDEIITGLTPGETMTVYMWAVSGVFGNNNRATATMDKGVTVYEVID